MLGQGSIYFAIDLDAIAPSKQFICKSLTQYMTFTISALSKNQISNIPVILKISINTNEAPPQNTTANVDHNAPLTHQKLKHTTRFNLDATWTRF